jgi:hypothetical protein
MRFKGNKEDDSRELEIVDSYGDKLTIDCSPGGPVYIGVNGSVFVRMSKRRALAVAKAIIEELS